MSLFYLFLFSESLKYTKTRLNFYVIQNFNFQSLSHIRLSCDPMDWSPPGSSVHGISQGKNTEVGCYFLFQGIFPTQELNLCLQHWQVDSLPLSHQGIPDKKVIGIKLGFPGGSVIIYMQCRSRRIPWTEQPGGLYSPQVAKNQTRLKQVSMHADRKLADATVYNTAV